MTEQLLVDDSRLLSATDEARLEPCRPLDAFADVVSQYNFAEEARRVSAGFDKPAEQAALGVREAQLMEEAQAVASLDLDDPTTKQRLAELGAAHDSLAGDREELNFQTHFLDSRARLIEGGCFVLDAREERARKVLAGIVECARTEPAPFVPEEQIQAMTRERPSLTILLQPTDGLEIPLNAIVSAPGFQSWQTGRGQQPADGRSSREVIEDYADRLTKIPDIEDAAAIILPDNQVIFMTHNAHRVAAAKRRGQPTMTITGRLIVYTAKETAALQLFDGDFGATDAAA